MASTTTQSTIIVLQDLRRAQRSDGPAAVLAIGTAVPAHFVRQDEFTDWYFRVTNSNHLTELKAKTKRICDRSGIEKRYFHHTAETIGRHPEFLDRAVPSLGERQRVTYDVVAELAAAAAARAIAEWGRTASDITHLVVATNSSATEPGADLRVAALLGLPTAVRRTLLHLHGCSSGLAAVRVAKDIAENNRGARVLVACAHTALLSFGAPDESRPDALVTTALFGDGDGADPVGPTERPIFHLVSPAQGTATLPGTERAVAISLGEGGVEYRTSVAVPALVHGGVERCLVDALAPLGVPDVMSNGRGWNWNSLLWEVHPAGRALLDSYESALGLEAGKLAASRRVLSEYGNMLGATIIFVLDEIRRRRRRQDGEVEEDDCQWGVMSVLGPGLTIETMVFLLHVPGTPAATANTSS